MSTELNKGKRTMFFLAWGILDAVYIAWYCANSWLSGRIPYVNDLTATIELMSQQGGANLVTALASWLLQLSIAMSCLMFLVRARKVKYLIYIQTPFRIFFLIPSVSIILVAAQLLPGFSLAILALIIASETFKVWTSWKLS